MNIDESEKWNKNLTAMPISSSREAGSKYILLILTALLSSVILLLLGFWAEKKGLIAEPFILIYSLLGFFYAIAYGSIIIPAVYKFGVYNTKYILMIFIFIPTIIPLILNSLDINYNFDFILRLRLSTIVSIIIFLTIVMMSISFLLSKIILYKKEIS